VVSQRALRASTSRCDASIEPTRRRYPRAIRASRFAAMASRYGAAAFRSALVMDAEKSPTMVMPRLVRTARTSN